MVAGGEVLATGNTVPSPGLGTIRKKKKQEILICLTIFIDEFPVIIGTTNLYL